MKERSEGGGRRGEPTLAQAGRPEQTQTPQQRGEGIRGIPPPSEQSQPQQERGERRPLSGVWDYLEHRVKVYTHDPNRLFAERIRQKKAVNRWMEGLRKKGTLRDRLIIDLYTSITVQPGHGERSIRELSLEEFPQFCSRVEPLLDEEIAEEIRKEEEAKQRKIEESRQTNRLLTLAQPELIWKPPHPAMGTFS